jgi:hypothetical protein
MDFTVYDVTLDRADHINPVYHEPFRRVYSSDLDEVFKAYRETAFDAFVSSDTTHRIDAYLDDTNDIAFDSNNFKVSLNRMRAEGFIEDKAFLYPINLLGDVYQLVYGIPYSSSDPNLYYKLSKPNSPTEPNFPAAYGALVEEYIEIGNSYEPNITFVFIVCDEPGKDPYKRILADRLYTVIHEHNAQTSVTYHSACDDPCPSGASYNVPFEDGNIPPLTDLVDYKVWAPLYQYDGYTNSQDQNYHGFYGYYTTGHSHWRNPIYNRFLHGLFAFGTDATAVSAYAMGDYTNDPYNDFDAGYTHIFPFTYPDFLFAYPTWSGELLYTIGGLEGIREGIKDAKYIATLKRLIEEDPGDPNSSDANDYLQDVKSRIKTDFKTDYYSKATEYGYYDEILADINESNDANDFEAFTRIRKEIADHIHIVACSTDYYGVHNVTQDKWYTSINTAIDEANSADEIVLSKGSYYESIDFDGKAITVRSEDPNDWEVVAATIIDANGSGNVVTFDSNEDANSVLKGFTITGGGRGIYCSGASPTISKCIVTGNATTGDGGGMYNVSSSSPTVTNCFFVGNTASSDGAGMCNDDGSCPVVVNCVFYDNAGDDGGGMYNEDDSLPTVINCTFFANDADDDGGGICNWDGCDATLYNCIFWGNTAQGGDGEIYNHDSEPTFSYCDIEGSLNGDKCGGDDSNDGGHNDNDYPEFVNSSDPNGADDTWGTSDDGLIPTEEDVVDEGDDDTVDEYDIETDIKGDDRIIDNHVDMGAYEYDSGC